MKLLVCISNVPDTTTKVKFTDNQTKFDSSGVQWIINPWDELALTRAVDLKEESNNPVSEVVVVNVGSAETEPTLRKCLAIGADKAIRIDSATKDAFQTAKQIAAIAQKEAFDFIICGIESGDYNSSSVGGMLAEFLDISSISSVSDIRFDGPALPPPRGPGVRARNRHPLTPGLRRCSIRAAGFTFVPPVSATTSWARGI